MPRLSVIICTHNPVEAMLRRTLDALAAQDLPRDAWELLIVDNVSSPALAGRVDLAWHPGCRLLVEPRLGVSHARALGMRKAAGEILVFVDDDNVLASDYLRVALRIADDKPWLGAWGGNNFGEFETPPPTWARAYLWGLALREVDRDMWTKRASPGPETPVGAGMVIRRSVAAAYLASCASDPRRIALFGRSGSSLSAGEDIDIALTAIDQGLAVGVFPALRLVHLIPERRLRPEYLARLHAGIELCHHLLMALRVANHRPPPRPGLARRLLALWRSRVLPREVRAIEAARSRAREQARAFLASPAP